MRLRFLAVVMTALLLLGALPVQAAPPAASLAVTVTGTGGAPLEGARVELIAPGAGTVAAARTDATGRTSLSAPAAVPTFWVRAWARGRATVDRPWVPGTGGTGLALDLAPLTGALGGLVTDHLGLPVPGARISAWRTGAGLAAEATTGPNGTFALRNLPAPGPYLVQATAVGFRAFTVSATRVPAGEEQRLDVALAPGSATVSGEAADARTGAPLPGARVELLRKGWGILGATVTAADGTFTLMAPPSESPDYTVRVWAPGHALTVSAPFALAPGARRELTGTERLLAQPRGGSIWGVLTGDGGQALDEVPVELHLQGAGTVASTATDAAGFFAFDGADAGTYRVRAFPKQGSSYGPVDSAWTALPPGASRSLELLATPFVRRLYRQGAVAGVVSDPAGRPLAGARVTLSRGDETAAYTATTDAQGRYRLTEVDANRPLDARTPGPGYVIRVAKDGYWPTDQPTAGPAGALPLLDVVETRVTQADFTLRPRSGALSGRVTDDQGYPLAGASVTLYRDGEGAVAAATAGPDGRYRFRSVPAPLQAGYVVLAEHAGYYATATENALDVALAPGGIAQATLRLRPTAARLHGRVADAFGAPLAGAAVTILNPVDGHTWEVQADAGGWYAVDQLPAGPGDFLMVRSGSAAAGEGAIALAGARARTVNLEPALPGAAAGTVYGPDGMPLAGATVELWREGAVEPAARTQSGPDGTYRFTGLAAGDRYAITAGKEGYIPSALAPGEASLTPLFRAVSGEATHQDRALSRP